MELIIEPDDGINPLVRAIDRATTRIDIVVFRFDLAHVEEALKAAVGRGVIVRALIAHTNKNGERKLRQLEDRLLGYGATVDRTGDDLVRYHGKLLIVDARQAFVLGFNYTHLDVHNSRSFGVVSTNKRLVSELMRLISADASRHPFTGEEKHLVVSPENSRQRLGAFLRQARKELLIYDPDLSDDAMILLLKERARAGVSVRIIGKLEKKWRGPDIDVAPLPTRLHVRAIIRDGSSAFIGSQSLRKLELDGRREVGVLLQELHIVRRLVDTFEADWALSTGKRASARAKARAGKTRGKTKRPKARAKPKARQTQVNAAARQTRVKAKVRKAPARRAVKAARKRAGRS
jgi:phosphatidylserine/phosphatidylglycerophosphate/cardiolipin synthase-like enzyme